MCRVVMEVLEVVFHVLEAMVGANLEVVEGMLLEAVDGVLCMLEVRMEGLSDIMMYCGVPLLLR
jgi:hypothetical protein